MKRFIIVLYIVLAIVFLASCKQEIEIANITNLFARPDGADITVSWDGSSNANCYYIYRAENDNENYNYWGVTDKTEIKDVTVWEDSWYSYRVYPAILTDDGYVRGDKYMSSDNVLALTKPQILKVEKTDAKCVINWDELDNASYYSVFRKEQRETEYKLLGDTTQNYYIDRSSNDDKIYNYIIKMSTTVNEETYTSLPSNVVLAYNLPKISSIYREDLFTSVITWDSISDNIEYSVFRSLTPQGEYELIGTTYNNYFRDIRVDKAVTTTSTETTQPTIDYYYMIKINNNNQEKISYYSESQSMKMDLPQSTSRFFVSRYVDFINEDNGPKILSEDTIYDYEFEQDLKFLKEEGYVTITSKEILDYINNRAPLPEKAVMITIDGARSGVYKYAYPLLKKYNMKAILGVVGEYADKAGISSKYCSWEEITIMYNSGCFELASNSYYLNDTEQTSADKRSGVTKLPHETNDQYKKILEADVNLINTKLNNITGKKPNIFIYPLGARGEASDQALINDFGYKLLLGDDDSRRTRMNHFIDNAPLGTQLRLLNRRDRLSDIKLSKYIIAAQRYDEPDILSDTAE